MNKDFDYFQDLDKEVERRVSGKYESCPDVRFHAAMKITDGDKKLSKTYAKNPCIDEPDGFVAEVRKITLNDMFSTCNFCEEREKKISKKKYSSFIDYYEGSAHDEYNKNFVSHDQCKTYQNVIAKN